MKVPVSVEVPVELLLPAAKAAASAPASPPANGSSHDRYVESKVPSVVADSNSTHAGRPPVITAVSSPTTVPWFRTLALSWPAHTNVTLARSGLEREGRTCEHISFMLARPRAAGTPKQNNNHTPP